MNAGVRITPFSPSALHIGPSRWCSDSHANDDCPPCSARSHIRYFRRMVSAYGSLVKDTCREMTIYSACHRGECSLKDLLLICPKPVILYLGLAREFRRRMNLACAYKVFMPSIVRFHMFRRPYNSPGFYRAVAAFFSVRGVPLAWPALTIIFSPSLMWVAIHLLSRWLASGRMAKSSSSNRAYPVESYVYVHPLPSTSLAAFMHSCGNSHCKLP